MGNAIIDWVNMSGVGVIIAPKTNDKNTTIRQYFFNESPVINPNFPNMVITSGNSNIKPNGKINAKTKSKYLPTENIAANSASPKLKKNLSPAGKTKKNENANPAKNNTTDAGTIMPKTARSFLVNAGRKNLHT